jgi:hypothetical protein
VLKGLRIKSEIKVALSSAIGDWALKGDDHGG